MIDFSKIKCTGCTACVSICSKKVIIMENDEEGFPTPRFDKVENCIECGMCERVCPVINYGKELINKNEKAIIAQIKNEAIRKESASGGMFSAIAIAVINAGGIVYGAAYDKNYKVHHIGISSINQLWRLRNSKYVQSDLGRVFLEIKEYLNSNQLVCFSGTPCQVEGLSSFLRKPYDNLLLIDITCHGVGSPLIWNKYLEFAQHYNPTRIYFRWKHYGYKYSTMSFFNKKNQEVYFGDVETDSMLRAYFTNSCDRKTCYNCMFKKRYRISDFTLWDCFQPRFFNRSFDDDKGTSSVLINSIKGQKWLAKIKELGLIKYFNISPDDLVYGNHEMIQSVKESPIRDKLLKDACFMDGEKLFRKYFPDNFKSKIRRLIRIVLLKSGLYGKVKYMIYKHRRAK